MKVLTEDEMQRFLIQAKYDGCFGICLLAITTDMRRCEIMGLQWQDIDFESGKLETRRQAYYLNGKMQTSEPKSETRKEYTIFIEFCCGQLCGQSNFMLETTVKIENKKCQNSSKIKGLDTFILVEVEGKRVGNS